MGAIATTVSASSICCNICRQSAAISGERPSSHRNLPSQHKCFTAEGVVLDVRKLMHDCMGPCSYDIVVHARHWSTGT